MAIALRGTPTTSGTSDTFASSKAVNVPAGAAIGDVAILIVEHWTSSTEPTVTNWGTGFTEIPGAHANKATTSSVGNQGIRMAWKRLTAADTGTYTITFSATTWNLLHCVMWSGAQATGDPIEAANTAVTSVNSTTVPAVSVSVTGTGDGSVHSNASTQVGTQTPPTGWTERLDNDTIGTNTRVFAGAGSFNATGGTRSSSSEIVVALIAISADVTGVGPVTGVGVAATDTMTAAAGRKSAAGVGGSPSRDVTLSAASKSVIRAGLAAARTMTAVAATHTVTGTGAAAARTQTVSAASHAATGTGNAPARTMTLSAASRAVTGAGSAATRVQTQATSQPGGPGRAAARVSTQATGGKVITGPGLSPCRVSTRATGIKAPAAAGLASARTATRGPGTKAVISAPGRAAARTHTQGLSLRAVTGAGLASARVMTVAVHLSGQTGLRIRGRGRENDTTIHGRENRRRVTGREQGTL